MASNIWADTHTWNYNVKMTCSGCSNAVNKVLSKDPEITHIDISLEKQSVTVKTTKSSDQVLEMIKKTGKECSFAG